MRCFNCNCKMKLDLSILDFDLYHCKKCSIKTYQKLYAENSQFKSLILNKIIKIQYFHLNNSLYFCIYKNGLESAPIKVNMLKDIYDIDVNKRKKFLIKTVKLHIQTEIFK